MIIDDREGTETYLGDLMDDMARTSFKTHIHKCHNCKTPIVYPIMVKKSDVDLFETVLKSAERVMLKYGITGNLLAEIRAECFTEIAKKKSKVPK